MTEWKVQVDEEMNESLAKDFRDGPIMEDGLRLLEEQQVAWLEGLKIEVFSREHSPPHFRVSYQGQRADFDICTGESLGGDALKRWRRNIRNWHRLNRQRLIDAWNSSRPADCPVGEVRC
jgi:hypothetical protein